MANSRQANTGEPYYDVLWPLSRKATKTAAAAPRIPDLNGKTIRELWDVIFRGEVMGHSFSYWSHTGFKQGRWNALIVVSPNIANVIAREWSKDQVRRYLHEHVKVTAERAAY